MNKKIWMCHVTIECFQNVWHISIEYCQFIKYYVLFFSSPNYAGENIPFTITSGLVAAENFHIAVSIATTTIESQKITVSAGR